MCDYVSLENIQQQWHLCECQRPMLHIMVLILFLKVKWQLAIVKH